MQWLTLAIALAGLGISGALGAVKIWEVFYSRAKFTIATEWFDASDTELEFRFTISNVGHRAASIRSISITDERGEGYQSASIARQLPVHLQPGESSNQFTFDVRTDVAHDPGTSLFVGKGRVIAIDSAGTPHEFDVSNPYDGRGIMGWADEPPDTES